MSLMLKGFEFPKSCRECWFIYPEGLHSGSCIFTDKYWELEEDVPSKSRLPECPLVEIPTPHGRLIDADEIKEKLLKYGFKAPDMTATEFVEDELSTIVEAEVSK